MHWVANNREWFPDYVGTLADRMGLQDWRIIVMPDPPPGDVDGDGGALSVVIYGRKVVKLWFATPDSPEELRHWVVHELLHCHAALLDWNANSIKRALSDQVFHVWRGGFEDATELMIDGIAMAWAEMVPLPTQEIQTPDAGLDHVTIPEGVGHV